MTDEDLLAAISADWNPMYRNVWYSIAAFFVIMGMAFLVDLWFGLVAFFIAGGVGISVFFIFLGIAGFHLARWSQLWPEVNRRRKLGKAGGPLH